MASKIFLYRDDNIFSEAGIAFVTKKTLRVVSDSTTPVTLWRAVITLRNSGTPGSVSFRIQIGADVSEIITTSVVSETVFFVSWPKTAADNVPLTAIWQIKANVVGPVAALRYTELYAVL